MHEYSKSNVRYLKSQVYNTLESYLTVKHFQTEVWRKFNFYAPRGQEQISGCAKALRILDAAGHVKLPVTTRKASAKKSPQRLNTPITKSRKASFSSVNTYGSKPT